MKKTQDYLQKTYDMIKGFQEGDTKSTLEVCSLITGFINKNIRPYKDIFKLSDYDYEDIEQDIYVRCLETAKVEDYLNETRLRFFKYNILNRCNNIFEMTMCHKYNISHNQYNLYSKVCQFIADFINVSNEEPYDDTIKIALHLSDSQILDYKKICNKLSMDISYESLDESDSIIDENDAFESVEINCLHTALMNIMNDLTPREYEVIIHRFGMDGDDYKTLEFIGDAMGLQRERIRQIESKALRKLRHPSRSKRIKDYLL